MDLILFVGIWLIACVVWVPQPIEFMVDLDYTAIEQHTRPMAPAFEIFPWKDSRTYYTITESIKNGSGIYRSIDKSLFLSISSVINWLAGGSYEKMLMIQAGLLAVFPAVIYLIGKNLHSRSAGILAASFAIFQELNGILLMDEFPLVSSKVLLSEPYMQLWNALIVLGVISALKNKGKVQPRTFIISGGVLGLSALTRLNTFVIIPFLLLLFFIQYFKDKEIFLKATIFFMLGLLVSLMPWMIHNAIIYDDPIAFINGKVRGVIINNRYSQISSINNLEIEKIPVNETIQLLLDTSSQDDLNHASLMPSVSKLENILIIIIKELSLRSEILTSIFRHYLNNIATSFSTLPVSALPQDLFHGARTQRFWDGPVSAQYASIDFSVILLNLILLAIGVAEAIRRKGVVGLVPIAVYLGYHLANAIAVSSGNRYAQPASWMVFFYFALGLTTISEWYLQKITPVNTKVAGQIENSTQQASVKKANNQANIIILIILLGLSPVIADLVPSSRYQIKNPEAFAPILLNNALCKQALSEEGIDSPLNFDQKYDPDRYVMDYGKIYFPMEMDAQKFEAIFKQSFGQLARYENFTTALFLSHSTRIQQLIFSDHEKMASLSNGSDVVILTSRQGYYSFIKFLAFPETKNQKIITEELLEEIPIDCFFIN